MRSEWHWFVRCDLLIFSGCVCHLEQLHAQSPFLFPIVFSIIDFWTNKYTLTCLTIKAFMRFPVKVQWVRPQIHQCRTKYCGRKLLKVSPLLPIWAYLLNSLEHFLAIFVTLTKLNSSWIALKKAAIFLFWERKEVRRRREWGGRDRERRLGAANPESLFLFWDFVGLQVWQNLKRKALKERGKCALIPKMTKWGKQAIESRPWPVPFLSSPRQVLFSFPSPRQPQRRRPSPLPLPFICNQLLLSSTPHPHEFPVNQSHILQRSNPLNLVWVELIQDRSTNLENQVETIQTDWTYSITEWILVTTSSRVLEFCSPRCGPFSLQHLYGTSTDLTGTGSMRFDHVACFQKFNRAIFACWILYILDWRCLPVTSTILR